MRIATFIMTLVLVTFVMLALVSLQEQSLSISRTNNPELANLSNNLSYFANKTQGKMNALYVEVNNTLGDNQKEGDLFGFFQQLPSLLLVGVQSMDLAFELPNLLLTSIALSVPQLPPWIVPLVTGILIIYAVFKAYYLIRGSSEV